MPVGRGRADAGPARRFGKGEAGRPLLRDQIERGADQRLLQIAVVIAARARCPACPAHVKGAYMTPREASTCRASAASAPAWQSRARLPPGAHGGSERNRDALRRAARNERDAHLRLDQGLRRRAGPSAAA